VAAKVVRAIGRRKTAVARVMLKSGAESIKANGTELKAYFKNDRLVIEIEKPLKLVEKLGQFSIHANLSGGGLTGQAEALQLGIARALCIVDPTLKTALKKEKMLTRDAREVERKKYGRAGARRRFQFSKR